MAQLFGLARIGRDVELRYLTDGKAVANISLAFNYGKKGQDGKRPTQWVEASMWGARAEALAPYLLKGTMVSATLSDVHIETFDNKGTQGYKLVGMVSDIELAGSNQQVANTAPAPRQVASAPRPAPPKPASNFSDMDDDIPF